MLRRRQLLDILVAEKNHLLSIHPCQRTSVEEHIAWLEDKLAQINQEIQALWWVALWWVADVGESFRAKLENQFHI